MAELCQFERKCKVLLRDYGYVVHGDALFSNDEFSLRFITKVRDYHDALEYVRPNFAKDEEFVKRFNRIMGY